MGELWRGCCCPPRALLDKIGQKLKRERLVGDRWSAAAGGSVVLITYCNLEKADPNRKNAVHANEEKPKMKG